MRLTLQFPLHFKARPRRARMQHHVLVRCPFETDIAEISPGEAVTVFETRSRYALPENETPEHFGYRLLAHRGRLYRRLATPSLVRAVTANAFNNSWMGAAHPPPISLARMPGEPTTVGTALQRQAEWRLSGESGKYDLKERTWPDHDRRTSMKLRLTGQNNKTVFADVRPDLKDIDHSMIESAMDDFRYQAGKLLFIGRELWMECLPPSYTIEASEYPFEWATVSLRHLPEGPASWPEMLSFPLDRRDEAFEYARELSIARFGVPSVLDRTVPFTAETGDLVLFDQARLETTAFPHNMVLASNRYMASAAPEFVETFLTPDLAQAHAEAYSKVMRADFVRNVFEDLDGDFPAIERLWRKCRRPCYDMYGYRDRTVTDLLLSRIYAHLENEPIRVPLPPGPGYT